ncbi:response regulator [Paenibacillus filicis]|uniref:Response regulator n=1 Tax=Paenibacillus gyeongsangnamensis TaxID=3388067 RepID=A0ABT4QEZ3_9BACL|nr:response regulator [Paenibacillus filicis]MCZ8515431.1 response regulator [Paenibacillus filicis]
MYNVMIVDDEIMIKKGLSKLIGDSPYGFRISGEAEDGDEALALWEKEPADLIITDISMPVMDGLEFIREVRKNGGYRDFIRLRRICLCPARTAVWRCRLLVKAG